MTVLQAAAALWRDQVQLNGLRRLEREGTDCRWELSNVEVVVGLRRVALLLLSTPANDAVFAYGGDAA